jgi:hypothetical protein
VLVINRQRDLCGKRALLAYLCTYAKINGLRNLLETDVSQVGPQLHYGMSQQPALQPWQQLGEFPAVQQHSAFILTDDHLSPGHARGLLHYALLFAYHSGHAPERSTQVWVYGFKKRQDFVAQSVT